MKTIKIYQVDAFTSRVFGGNPAAVCPLDAWLEDDIMLKIAAENNLSETAFFVKVGSIFHIRWFTPTTEVDLCGHATLATAHVLIHHLGFENDQIDFVCKVGSISVSRVDDDLQLNFPVDILRDVDVPTLVSSQFGEISIEAFAGKYDLLVVLEDEDLVVQLDLDLAKIALLKEYRGVIFTAPSQNVDFVSRVFAPQSGINEDPATGSAHCTLTAFWAKRLGKSTLVAKQVSARGGDLTCTLQNDRVLIQGKAVTYLIGEIFFN